MTKVALNKILQWVLIAIATIVVLVSWFGRPSGALIEKDPEQNLAMAYNLRHNGIMSTDTDRAPEALRPSRYREPLPVLMLSGYLLALDPLLGDQPFNTLLEGDKARLLKYSNVFWGMLLVWAMVLSARRLGMPGWGAALAVLLAHISLDTYYDSLYTEVPAAALIALSSYLALLAVRERHLLNFLAAGLSFGLLILTKASFLYVALALVLLYLLYALIESRSSAQRRFAFTSSLLLLLSAAIVISPWLLRNQLQFGSPALTERGGQVLLVRAVKNGMTSAEYVGTAFAYAPRILQKPIGALMGYKPEDLQAGGRLERLHRAANPADQQAVAEGRPDDAISYYRRGMAIRSARLAALEVAGHPNPVAAVDAELQTEAIAMIKAHPFEHLAMTLPFLWRGAPFMGPFLILMLLYACRRRDVQLAVYILPALGLIGFYAFFSHFISRYAQMNAPIVAMCIALLLYRWLQRRRMRATTA